ncbi:Protein CBG12307 [Caenorhabditis briggsae]|uniref:Protein CBG12307 n=1 Tax=Caenorhabditis briggsae TaxID=6238 RepID=A8XF81_CAEBR|nr:Protein CBG12307 [Caenorhabditis briggsae]CAP31303.2 Protein CBG12307 [Caenorhabditis briggsae]
MDADSLDESSKDYIPPAVVKVNQKYDELFSSVVSNAFMMDIQKTPDQYYAEKAAQQLQNPPESDSDSEDVIQLDDSSEDVIEVDVLESRLTDIKKQLKETKKSVKAIRRKQRYAEKAAARIAADLLKFSKKSVVKELKMRNSESTSSSTSSDIEILETVPMEHPCSCGQVFEDHMECHRHIFEEHADNDVTGDCVHCGHRREQIFAGNGCYICYKFAPNLDEHLAGHYRNCTAKHAVMECRFCPKQFKTEVGECPFCRLNFASRKCFKNHLLRSHWLACKSVSNMSLEDIKSMGTTTTVDDQKGTVDQRSDEEIRKEINELSKMAEVHERMRIVTEEMKREVKDEIEDDGYHGNY